MEFKTCSNLSDFPNEVEWDLSNVTEFISLSRMNEAQAKYCFENNLLYNYPMVGMAVLIDGKIKQWFNDL